jgi:fatty-acyl-CoA synthase
MFNANCWGTPYAITGLGGQHIVLRKVDGPEILRRIEQHGVTILRGAPTVVSAILDAAPTWDGPIPGRDRVRIVVAGAPPPTRTIERVRTELGWEFIQIYGLTETSPLLTVNRTRTEWADLDTPQHARLLGRAGTPALGVRIRLGADGEVLAQSNTNLAGYWHNPQETARAQAGNWFHTGDRGSFEGGYLTIADRKKDVIITGGENVSSIEVEDALASHPSIREVAVIGRTTDGVRQSPLSSSRIARDRAFRN